jgi:hypothetical protein
MHPPDYQPPDRAATSTDDFPTTLPIDVHHARLTLARMLRETRRGRDDSRSDRGIVLRTDDRRPR